VAVVFFLLGFGALSASPVLTMTGGFLGIVAAGLAWYLCLAGIAASTFGRPILPNPPPVHILIEQHPDRIHTAMARRYDPCR